MIFAAAAIAVQAAAFAPPLGVPIRVVTERNEGEWHFRVERLIRFSREDGGWRAEVRMIAATGTGPEQASQMMSAGYSGLAGKVLVFHLDAQGKLTALDHQPALWSSFCDGIVAILRVRRANADSLAGPLRALPPDRQRLILGSLVTALVADEAGEPAGIRAIRLPGGSPFGGPVTLEGMRTITRTDTALHSATRASGPAAGGTIALEISREIDPLTGLLISADETSITADGTSRTERQSTVRVTIEPATAWP